ncbi:MAG: glucose-1-phosphate cytidylyltransferase [Pseudomonadota bacterium]
MKVAILAGGFGTRISEESDFRPKPMVEIGLKPILWHIMMLYSSHGFNDFAIALGYKGDMIKRWMLDYFELSGDLRISPNLAKRKSNGNGSVNWTVDMIESGLNANTGGRIKAMSSVLSDGRFMLAYGDGVSNVDLRKVLAFHEAHGKLATMTIVRPPARFGHVELDGARVAQMSEKPQSAEGWINGGFFVLEPEVLEYIEDESTIFEREPLEQLAQDGQLMAYKHGGFWQCMDTLRDKRLLEKAWAEGKASWAVWEN